jgi:hypothetical protein
LALPDTINPNWIAHLRNQFQIARPVLFTGAGFSSATRNILGETVPTVWELKKKLWTICFPGENFDESVRLPDLFEHALLRNRNALRKVLTQSFTIVPSEMPSWYETYLTMPWQRWYTLNIDNFEVAADQRFQPPRKPLSISAVREPSKAVVSSDPSKILEVVHLNGTVEDAPDAVTFSVTQYAERLSRSEPWYLRFAADLLTSPVVFVGTSLDETPLWQHIVLRHGRGAGGLELRHRSYLVTPSLDKSRQSLLAEYNVMWMPMTAEQFARDLLPEFNAVVSSGLISLGRRTITSASKIPHLPEVAELAVNPSEENEFLLGQEPIWADIQSDRAIERECDRGLLDVAQKALAGDGIRGIILISGTAGSGKSTTLMRLCLKLLADGKRVAWIDRNTEISTMAIREAMKADEPPDVLAIDDADLFGNGLAILVRDIAHYHSRPLVVIALRSGKIDRAFNPTILEGVPLTEMVMPHLTDGDISLLIDLLSREKRLGVLTGKTLKEQEQAFREAAGRQLLVAMIKATSGVWLEEKAVNELTDLKGDAAKIYAFVAVVAAYRYYLTRDEIIIALGNYSNEAMNALDHLIKHRIIVERGGDFSARHRMLGDIIREKLFETGQMAPVVQGLAVVAAAKVTPSAKRYHRHMRMLQTFLNHELLLNVMGPEAGKNLYSNLEDPLAWHYHYWLQRGSLEVERGSLNLAENFLGTAFSLAEDDPLVRNEWAYLQFKKAINNPTAPEAADFVKEATQILEGLIANGGANQYPYGVIASQGLQWSRVGIKDPTRRAAYLRHLITKIEGGMKRYPGESQLKELLDELQREHLETAVKR